MAFLFICMSLMMVHVQGRATLQIITHAEYANHSTIKLAASQLRRYAHELGIGEGLALISEEQFFLCSAVTRPGIVIGTASSFFNVECPLSTQCMPADTKDAYAVCVHSVGSASIVGTTPLGALYGAIAFLEAHGVVFGLNGPIVPALHVTPPPGFQVKAEPAFIQRGLQPFHDFYSGPDWWNEDKYKEVTECLLGMKANQLALHTYPYGGPGSSPVSSADTGKNEPAVWVGVPADVNADGTVKSAYPAAWASTLRGQWGMNALNTSDELYAGLGAQAMYECDCYAGPGTIQNCNADLCPAAFNNDTAVQLFNEVGAMWQRLFPYAHALGVGTTMGTEMPLSMPPSAGIMLTLNVYYSASRGDHFVTSSQCNECEGLYAFLGIIGYVYEGPNPAVGATLALNTYYDGRPGHEDNVLAAAAPGPTYDFVRTEGYVSPTMIGAANLTLQQMITSNPKIDHWAVGGSSWVAKAQAAGFSLDSQEFPPSGVLGYIWPVGNGPAPVVQDYYEGILTRLTALVGPSCTDSSGKANGMCTYWVWTPESFEWQAVNISNPIIQNVVNDTLALHAARDALNAPFALATCGWVVGPLGARWYMDTVLAPDWSISSIDMDVGNTNVDPNYTNITRHPKWVIPWAEDDPGLTVPELWLNRTLAHARDAQAYGADGLLIIHWRTRVIDPQVSAGMAYAWNSSLVTQDAWWTWASAQFGPSATPGAVAVFLSVDSNDTPRPVNWISGPGGLKADSTQCGWAARYAFVDTFAALRALVLADISAGRADAWNLERFDYWSKAFSYMRGVARFECDWYGYDNIITTIQAISDPVQRQAAAQGVGYAARASLIANATRFLWDQMAEVTTPGELGILSNLIQHSVINAIGSDATAVLANLAGVPALPAGSPLNLPGTFDPAHPPLLRVPVHRTMLSAAEPFRARAFILSAPANLSPMSVTLFTAPLGSTNWTQVPMMHLTDGAQRFVYEIGLPAGYFVADFQWYIAAVLPSTGTEPWQAALPSAGLSASTGMITLVYPPTSPAKPQTVVIVDM